MRIIVDLTGVHPAEIVDFTDEVEEVAIKIEEIEPEPVECSICLEFIPPNCPGTLFRCQHQFHHDCITKWCGLSKSYPTCPYCRKPLTVAEAKYYIGRWNYLEESKAENQL